MFKFVEVSEAEGYSDSQILDVAFDLFTVIAAHRPAIIDFKFPRGRFLGLRFPCDDAMLCAITCYLDISQMFFACSLPVVGAAQVLFDVLEAVLSDGYRIAIP